METETASDIFCECVALTELRFELWPTQPPIQWVPGILSSGVKRGRGVTLTTHPI
jgi:hypothetical protein